MDNVTHTLAGLVLAESAVRLRARRTGIEPSARFRSVAAVSSVIAANLPDADLLYTGAGSSGLTYLLHHRGYTHTVVFAILGAALLLGGAAVVWRLRARAAPSREDAAWLFGLLLVNTFGHLVLDWTNSYGVHPFWPWDNRWRYGDAVFIVEPWFWAWTIPLLIAASTRRSVRVVLSLPLLAGLALAWLVDLVPPFAAAALTAGAALSMVMARKLRPDARAAAMVIGWIAVTLVMAAGSRRAREAAVQSVRAADPETQLLDVIVSPFPATPVCSEVIALERAGTMYRASKARVSAVPSLFDASRCPAGFRDEGALGESTRRSTRAVHWDAEWTAPVGELEKLARESCPARAALRFIRAPIWRPASDSTVILGDLRFGDGSGSGFSDVTVPLRSAACPPAVPPWTPPRTDLLESAVPYGMSVFGGRRPPDATTGAAVSSLPNRFVTRSDAASQRAPARRATFQPLTTKTGGAPCSPSAG